MPITSALCSMPVLSASAPMSVSTTSICWAMKAGSTATTPCTPSVFWAVRAVIAVAAKPPMAVTALMSAWMPAPPPESEPATIRTRPFMPPGRGSASMIWSTTVRTSSESSPSAMTRISGSVPDLRTRTRPPAPSRASAAAIACFTDASASVALASPRIRTFFKSCGTGLKARKVSLAGRPALSIAASACSAAISPSPVVA